jgi:AcrR family transcriptional regulator
MSQVRLVPEVERLLRSARPRRLPTQARSRARVQRLLDAADEIIGSQGFDALTIPLLAARASVPVGSVYQFFPDKTALIEAVAERYLLLFADEMQHIIDEAVQLDWDAAVDVVVEHFATMYRRYPTYCELWLHGHLTDELRQRDKRSNDEQASMLAAALARRPEWGAPSPNLDRDARIAVEAADALLRYAFRLDPNGDQATIDQVKRLVSVYLLSGSPARGA